MEKEICHYVRVDVKTDGTVEVFYVQETFDLAEYVRAQVNWAQNCPFTRHGVRERFNWSDDELDRKPNHPDILLAHFTDHHGDDWFRENLKPKFIKTKTIKLNRFNLACLVAEPQHRCRNCDICIIVHKVTEVQ